MGMSPAEKKEAAVTINAALKDSQIVVVAHNMGLNAQATNDLRTAARQAGVDYKIAKNTIVKFALKGTVYEPMADMFKGPTAMASSKDPVAAAKALYEFAKKNDKLVIVGGAMGEMILDKAAVEKLAKLPSLNELRSKLCGLIVAAPTKLAVILQTPARNMVGVTKAYGEKA